MILDRCGHGFSEELVEGDVTVKIMLIPNNVFHGFFCRNTQLNVEFD